MKSIHFQKVHGSMNFSDIHTKNVAKDLIEKHIAAMGCAFREGRSEAAVQLHSIRRMERQRKAEAKRQGGLPVGLLDLERMRRPRSHLDVQGPDVASGAIDSSLEARERQATRAHQEAVKCMMSRFHREEAWMRNQPSVRGTPRNS